MLTDHERLPRRISEELGGDFIAHDATGAATASGSLQGIRYRWSTRNRVVGDNVPSHVPVHSVSFARPQHVRDGVGRAPRWLIVETQRSAIPLSGFALAALGRGLASLAPSLVELLFYGTAGRPSLLVTAHSLDIRLSGRNLEPRHAVRVLRECCAELSRLSP